MTIFYIFPIAVIAVILLYLWAIMPRVVRRPDTIPFQEWLYAHRGLHDNTTDAPENSIRAFEKAVNAGYGIELDVQLSKDKIPVVFHDATLTRICGVEGNVSDYTYEELQGFSLCGTDEIIPRFADVLKLVDGRVPLIIEFKTESTDISVCPVADAILRGYRGRYCIESFNPLAVSWYRKHHNDIVRGQLADYFWKQENPQKNLLYFSLQYLLLNFLSRPDFIAYNHQHPHVLSRTLCRVLFRSLSVAWTIRSQRELELAKEHFEVFIFDSFIPELRD
ncbi:MAG: glycerophosphodiester phosphodiesterase [Lachnospiraceae bacterium]|nr:glycerophosphodiester phosphodiesterase [Lachnospiraceae bacterium]